VPSPATSSRFAQVAVLAQLGRAGGLFTYRLPDALLAAAVPGSLVRVPFTSRQVQGVVVSLSETCDLPKVRDVGDLLDPVPAVTPHGLRLAEWISRYYFAPMSDVLGAMLPPELDRRTVYLLEPGDDPERSRLDGLQREVLAAIGQSAPLLQSDLSRTLGPTDGQSADRSPEAVKKAVDSLVRRGLVRRTAQLAAPKTVARMETVVHLTDLGRDLDLDDGGLRRAPRRRQVLQQLVAGGSAPLSALNTALPGASVAVRALEAQGLVRTEKVAVDRSPIVNGHHPTTEPLALSPPQAAAFREVRDALRARRARIFLLHGVTGSGKTEVYLQAVDETLKLGRGAIVMVPEISLTPQAVERFAGRFPGRVAVLHSKLSAGERLDEWQRIRSGAADVVVGPRSALFAPLRDPGLIVVDEEHDPSYKQDSSPRYHARDAAAVLGRLTGATVIFGSATPDVGTYSAALEGRIRLLELPARPEWGTSEVRPMPSVEVVDMRHELKAGNRSIFSGALLEALDHTLSAGHQALLFLNRRGSATVVLCRDCGYVCRCPNCDIPFTYHASATRLVCHRCDKRIVSPRVCPACRSPRIRYLGTGTQRVEEEAARLFPAARVLRWDRDVTGGKHAHEAILQTFARHDADILVGTQMIAKGLDFPLVTLVGVISADSGLHMPDFRAPERSFQLLTQVAGRAGRSNLPSRVVVQTYTPDHYAVQAAMRHDYHRFYADEIAFRRTACYPPFARMIRFVYSSQDLDQCKQSAANFRAVIERAMRDDELSGIELIGPAPCFVAKVKSRYYWQLIARGTGRTGGGLQSLLDYVLPGWSVDVDPVDLL
jgi:primosomal protein N' (replication factor Y) (superfamily II helicase)